MNKYVNLQVIITSIVAGTIFGLFFKMIEQITGSRVYTLLLNIDYFPILSSYRFPEIIEFSFHLIISLAITSCIFVIRNKYYWSNSKLIINSIIIQIIIGCLLFPTTALSQRTPAFNDGEAFIWWIVGHIFYGLLLGICLTKNKKTLLNTY